MKRVAYEHRSLGVLMQMGQQFGVALHDCRLHQLEDLNEKDAEWHLRKHLGKPFDVVDWEVHTVRLEDWIAKLLAILAAVRHAKTR